MFIGHYAVGFGAKRATPRLSLGVLVLAVEWVDLVWPVLLIAGIERVRIVPGITKLTPLDFVSYPWTHSLLAAIVWSLLFAGVARWRGRSMREAVVLGVCVFSHWVLDFVTHRPDLQLYWGPQRVGLGLWNHVVPEIILEGGLFVAGLAVYLRATRAKDGIGTWSLWGFAAFIVVVWVANLFGPPPPSATMIGYAGLAQWLLVAWAFWIDRHREAVVGTAHDMD